MPHRLPKLLFLGLLVFVTRTDASPVLIGRDEWAGDSLWDLDMEDVFDAVSTGLGALPMVWDLLTAPGTTTTPSEVPSKQTDERFPLFEPTAMKTCAAEGESQGRQVDVLAVEHSWWQAEQEPETGYVAPKKSYEYDCLSQLRGITMRNGEKENADQALYTDDL